MDGEELDGVRPQLTRDARGREQLIASPLDDSDSSSISGWEVMLVVLVLRRMDVCGSLWTQVYSIYPSWLCYSSFLRYISVGRGRWQTLVYAYGLMQGCVCLY